jgi:hypothetical protein
LGPVKDLRLAAFVASMLLGDLPIPGQAVEIRLRLHLTLSETSSPDFYTIYLPGSSDESVITSEEVAL